MPDNDPKVAVKAWSDDAAKLRSIFDELGRRLSDLPIEGETRQRLLASMHHAQLVIGTVVQELADRGKKE